MDNKELRLLLKEHGIDARRLSHFSQLAIGGVLPLLNDIPQNTAIYLGSKFSSPSKFNKMFRQLHEQNIPSPLDFTANLNNATTFQLAKLLKTRATSLFIAVDRHNLLQPLELALLDLQANVTQTALVGWVIESTTSIEKEGWCWLLLNNKSNDEKEINITNLSHFPLISELHNLFKIV